MSMLVMLLMNKSNLIIAVVFLKKGKINQIASGFHNWLDAGYFYYIT